MPHPSFAQSPTNEPTGITGQTKLQFTTAMPLRDAASFVLAHYRTAGYQIVGGDSEEHEADIEWAHGAITGKTRLSGTANCSTTWTVVANAPTGTP